VQINRDKLAAAEGTAGMSLEIAREDLTGKL